MGCKCRDDWRNAAEKHLAVLHVHLGLYQQHVMDLGCKLHRSSLDEYGNKLARIHSHVRSLIPDLQSAEEQLRMLEDCDDG